MEVSVSSITTKGQITIPKEIREALDLREGDKVIFTIEGDRAMIRKVSGEKLSDILSRQKPWAEASLEFQKRLRKEWESQRS